MYYAQDGKLYCENPRDDKGAVEVCTCVQVGNNSPVETAEILADSLNRPKTNKSRAEQKDEHLEKMWEYLICVGKKAVPGCIWDGINRAYEI